MSSIPGYQDLQRQAKRAKLEAENKAAGEIFEWYRAEEERLDADAALTIVERDYAKRQLVMEFGRRSKKALAKAKRDNTVPKLLERQVRAEIDGERASRS